MAQRIEFQLRVPHFVQTLHHVALAQFHWRHTAHHTTHLSGGGVLNTRQIRQGEFHPLHPPCIGRAIAQTARRLQNGVMAIVLLVLYLKIFPHEGLKGIDGFQTLEVKPGFLHQFLVWLDIRGVPVDRLYPVVGFGVQVTHA